MRFLVTPRRGKGVIAFQDTGLAQMGSQVKKKILPNTFGVLRVFFSKNIAFSPRNPQKEKR